jgi:hypothetical protein
MPRRGYRLSKEFCRCIKKVRRTVKLRKGRGAAAKESAAIAICVKSVLGSRGRTLRKFSCTKRGGPTLTTQAPLGQNK